MLQDEIFTETLNGKTGAKKRYSAMKKYFTFGKNEIRDDFKKPCVIDFEGEKYTSFCNRYSVVLTKEKAGEMEHFENTEKYINVTKMIEYKGTKREIDFTRILAEVKSKGYKLKKSEVKIDEDFKYVLKYDGAYFKIGLLDATYSIIDNGEKAEVYHQDGVRTSPIIIKNNIGIALILPINYKENIFENIGKIVVEV